MRQPHQPPLDTERNATNIAQNCDLFHGFESKSAKLFGINIARSELKTQYDKFSVFLLHLHFTSSTFLLYFIDLPI